MTDSACDTAALYDNKLHTQADWLGDLASLTDELSDLISLMDLDVSY